MPLPERSPGKPETKARPPVILGAKAFLDGNLIVHLAQETHRERSQGGVYYPAFRSSVNVFRDPNDNPIVKIRTVGQDPLRTTFHGVVIRDGEVVFVSSAKAFPSDSEHAGRHTLAGVSVSREGGISVFRRLSGQEGDEDLIEASRR